MSTSTSRHTPLRVAITGATGFLGSALADALRAEASAVVPISRQRDGTGRDAIHWNPDRDELDARRLEGVDAVVHLAGENVAQRWSDDTKRRIRQSRVRGTTLLASAIGSMDRPPRVLLSGSAIGIYGDRGTELLDESSAPGTGFLAEVVQAWEGATAGAERSGVRIAHLRTGVVLGAHGGALQKMLPPFRIGAGGKIGSGEQVVSWIGLGDWVRAVIFLLRAGQLSGAVNLVAPTPVTNAGLTAALGHALGRPAVLSVPEFALRLAYGEMAEATLFASQRVVPTRLLGAGFDFVHPTIDPALRATLAA